MAKLPKQNCISIVLLINSKLRTRDKGLFSFTKKFENFLLEISVWEKSHSREAWPLNRPRKAWNW